MESHIESHRSYHFALAIIVQALCDYYLSRDLQLSFGRASINRGEFSLYTCKLIICLAPVRFIRDEAEFDDKRQKPRFLSPEFTADDDVDIARTDGEIHTALTSLFARTKNR